MLYEIKIITVKITFFFLKFSILMDRYRNVEMQISIHKLITIVLEILINISTLETCFIKNPYLGGKEIHIKNN